jgi:hypothetical protein
MESGGMAVLSGMTAAGMADAVVRYIIHYINERVLNALTAHIHATGMSAAAIERVEGAARTYIRDAVRTDVDTSAFFEDGTSAFGAQWDAGEGQRLIDRLFTQSYQVVEAGLDDEKRRRA